MNNAIPTDRFNPAPDREPLPGDLSDALYSPPSPDPRACLYRLLRVLQALQFDAVDAGPLARDLYTAMFGTPALSRGERPGLYPTRDRARAFAMGQEAGRLLATDLDATLSGIIAGVEEAIREPA